MSDGTARPNTSTPVISGAAGALAGAVVNVVTFGLCGPPHPLPRPRPPTLPNAPTPSGLAGPLFLKGAVDELSSGAADALAGAVRNVVTFGLCGIVQHLSKELQHPVFTPVSQAVARRVAYHTFNHVGCVLEGARLC